MAEGDNRVLRDYALLQVSGITSSIVSPAIEANNFELNPVVIAFVERDQFADTHWTTLRHIFANYLRSATQSS